MSCSLRLGNIPTISFGYLFLALLLILPVSSDAYSTEDRQKFQRSIIDFQPQLNPNFKKVKRNNTKYIIVHTSELGLQTTLKVVSRGKLLRNGKKTYGGHTHYVIGRDGSTYRILDKKYEADHAGLSMWNGEENISKISIGIELAGYHYASITENQYQSVGMLIDILQDIYELDDRAVLTHSQVAYGRPNRWFEKDHRGRKRCAKNFAHTKAGVLPIWTYDPDVRSGRLVADLQLAGVFYNQQGYSAQTNDTNIISKTNTAWSISGEDYDARSTVYKFPDGRVYTGDQISDTIGWNNIPPKTVVLLDQEDSISLIKKEGPIKTISESLTAWSYAGTEYNHETTIYFLPSGQIRSGSKITDWDNLPDKTKLIVGYTGPYMLHEDQSGFQFSGSKHKDPKIVYYLPSNHLLSGDQVEDFTELPKGTLFFLPST